MVSLSKEVNKEFRVLISVKHPEWKELQAMGKSGYAKAQIIGAGQLSKYVGAENANKSFLSALRSKTDKHTIKLRSFGRIDFYSK